MSRPEEEDSASDTDLCRGQRRVSERQREIAIDLDLGLGLGFEELPALPEPGAGRGPPKGDETEPIRNWNRRRAAEGLDSNTNSHSPGR